MSQVNSLSSKNNISKEKKLSIYLLSFLLPLILMVAVLISKRVFPFGDKCILRTDFYHQYLPFHAELQNKLKNFGSLFYTYKVGLGTNFITLFAYYLACPLNILLFFVSENFLLEYITAVLMIKIALCGLTSSIYFVNKFKTDSFACVFLSIFYAMSGYIGAYYWNIMWIDNVLLFPLLLLSFENMQNNGKIFKFSLLLGLSILCNYYIGAITCIFFIFYFIFYNVLSEYKIKRVLGNFVKTGIGSIIGVMISAILLLPIIFAFKTTASYESDFPSKIKEYFTILEVVGRHLPFAKVENGIEYWPNLFSGTIIFILIPLYFVSKKYKIREKIAYGILILFFIASFSINALDYVWHVGKFPNSLPARQSFIYTLLLLTIAMKPLLKINSIKSKDIGFALLVPFAILIIGQKSVETVKVGYYSIYAAFLFIFIYAGLLLSYKNKKIDKNIIIYVSIIFLSFEAFFNIYYTSITTIKRDDYMKNTTDIKKLTSSLKDITDDFYRVEREHMLSKDDGAFLHFPSASIFSSSTYKSGSDFYKKFGMEASTNAYSQTGSTPFMDSLLSVKYKVYEEDEKNAREMNMREISSENKVHLYQHLNTLPFSYVLTDKFLKDYDMTSGNPVTVQNNFARTMNLPVMMHKIDITEEGKNCKAIIKEDGDYYVFIRDKGIKEVSVVYPTTTKSFKNMNRGYLIELGYLNKDTDLEFRNETNDSPLLMELFRFDYSALSKVTDKINENFVYKMNYFDDTNIDFYLKSKVKGSAVVTLPYDDGFTVYMDGEKIESKAIMDFFLGFDITEGEHNIQIKYAPTGFKYGAYITILGLILLLFLSYYELRIRKSR